MHKNYPIKRFNAWHLGETVKYCSVPTSKEGLVDAYLSYQDKKTIWLGLGSNILFPDHELDAHIIRTHKALSKLKEEEVIEVEAGVALAKLARFCVKRGYSDAAFLAGIPGTLGGALMTNAGAYHHEIWRYVLSVEVLTKDGIEIKYPKDFLIGYRWVKPFEGFVAFLSAKIRFKKTSVEEGLEKIKRFLLMRNTTQPIGTFNCGSVFRNPTGRSAGRLIDDLGLRGYAIGDARISPMHGNFIENVNANAKSKDIMRLITLMRQAIWDAYRIRLSLEVKVYE